MRNSWQIAIYRYISTQYAALGYLPRLGTLPVYLQATQVEACPKQPETKPHKLFTVYCVVV